MAINYPTSLDTFTNPGASDLMNSTGVPHATQHSDINDAVEAIQAKVGVNSSTASTSIDKRVATLETAEIPDTIIDAKGDLIVGSAADTAARQAVGTNGYILTARSTATNGVQWEAASTGAAAVDPIPLILALS